MPCPATVTMWAECRRRSVKAVLYGFPCEPVQAWVPNWAHTSITGQTGPHGTRYSLRLDVSRRWLAEKFPEALAKLEAGAPRRVLPVAPRLVVTRESPAAGDLVLGFIAALRDSRLDDGEAATVLGLSERQVSCLRRGYLRVETDAELQRVEAALRQELQRQATVTGLPTEGA